MEPNQTESLSFDQLPRAVIELRNAVNDNNQLIRRFFEKNEPHQEPDRWLDINELCHYLPDKPAKPTVYGWVSCKAIPVHRGSKKLRFLKSEIDAWLKLGRRKTILELESEARAYTKKKGALHG